MVTLAQADNKGSRIIETAAIVLIFLKPSSLVIAAYFDCSSIPRVVNVTPKIENTMKTISPILHLSPKVKYERIIVAMGEKLLAMP